MVLSFIQVTPADAAVIHGTVYDMQLNAARNTIVTINTEPKQSFVATNGTYTFLLNLGSYELSARHIENVYTFKTVQNISIVQDGDFVIDLLLLLDIEDAESLTDENVSVSDLYPSEPIIPNKEGSSIIVVIIALLAIIIVLLIYISYKKTNRPSQQDIRDTVALAEEDDIGLQILYYIKEEHGRVNQRDIHRKFPISEAKVSLIVKELEAKGLVEKIKKGKGNIIKLRQEK
jgi:uncharacterized membrane protein